MLTESELALYFAVSLASMRSFLRCRCRCFSGKYNLEEVKETMGVR